MITQQNIRASVVTIVLAIATISLLQSVNEDWQAVASDVQAQLAQKQLPIPPQEEYVTRLFNLSSNNSPDSFLNGFTSTPDFDNKILSTAESGFEAQNLLKFCPEYCSKRLVQFEGRKYLFSSDGQRLLTESSYGLGRYYLYNVSGKKLLEFEGRQARFSLDGQRLLVILRGKDYFQLYDNMGRKLTQLPGTVQLPIFSQDGQRLVTLAKDSAYLSDVSGRRIAQIQGKFSDLFSDFGGGFSSDGQLILSQLDFSRQDLGSCTLFNSLGQTIARLPGACAGVSPKGQRFLTSAGTLDSLSLRLYNFSGKEIAQLPGVFAIFNRDEQFILTTDLNRGDSSYLYNSATKKITRLQGRNGRFSPSGKRLVTVSGNTVHLYDVSGKELAKLPGSLAAFLPKDEKFITYSFGANKQPLDISGGESRLFDGSGRELALLTGDFPGYNLTIFGAGVLSPFLQVYGRSFSFFSSDGQQLVTSDSKNSYLHNSLGKLVAQLPGLFLEFSATGQHLVTVSKGKERKVYLFDRSGTKLIEIDTQGAFSELSPDGQSIVIEAKRISP